MRGIKITNDGKCKDSSFEAEFVLDDSEYRGWGTLSATVYGDCESEAKLRVLDALRDMRDKLSTAIAEIEAWRDARTPEEIAKEQAEVRERARRRYGGW